MSAGRSGHRAACGTVPRETRVLLCQTSQNSNCRRRIVRTLPLPLLSTLKLLYFILKPKTFRKNALDSETLIDESWTGSGSVNSTDLAGVTTIDDSLKLSVHLHSGHFRQVSSILMFTCKKLVYIWDTERGEFLKLAGLDFGVSTSTLHQMPGLSSQEQFLR